MGMKFLLVVLLLPVAAFAAALAPLPAPEFADTEAATNVPIVVSFDAMSRIIS